MGLTETVSSFLGQDGARCDVDFEGERADWGEIVGTAPVAVLVVPATDALKQTAMGKVLGSLDRDSLWEVAGLSVDRELAESKPDDVSTVAGWLRHLRESGVEIEVIEQIDAP